MSNDERPGVAALVSGFLRFGLGSSFAHGRLFSISCWVPVAGTGVWRRARRPVRRFWGRSFICMSILHAPILAHARERSRKNNRQLIEFRRIKDADCM